MKEKIKEKESLEKWLEEFEKIEYQKTKVYALRCLSRQSYHSSRLKQLLIDRRVSKKIIEKIIEEMVRIGFLMDEAWIDSFIKRQIKKESLSLALLKLKAKKIPAQELEQAKLRWSDDLNTSEVLSNLLQTKYRKMNLNDYKIRAKVIQSLLRKGFQYNEINAILTRPLAGPILTSHDTD